MDYLLAQFPEQNDIELPIIPTQIQKFYSGKTLLITGGTGSLGKLLIGKLLHYCPDITKIYLILRAKNSQIRNRIEEFTQHPAFLNISSTSVEKIVIIRGDLSASKLAIHEKDLQKLVEETDIIFHLGGTTLFNESFRTSAEVNVRGTNELLDLAKHMKNLKVYLHVSSLFANCHRPTIDEDFERPYISGKALISFLESMDPNIYCQKPINLGKFPNNFLFTKSIAEDLIKNEKRCLPVVIVRLPLLISSEKYPSKGFTDTVNSLVGLTMTSYLGFNKSILAEKQYPAEVLPVDMGVNAIIAIAWDTAKLKSFNDNIEVPKDDQVQIYNLTTSKSNKLSWKMFFNLSSKYGWRFPTMHTQSFPWYILHSKKKWHFFLITIFHYIPGYCMDFITLYLFHQTKYIGYYTKIDLLSHALTYFTTHSWDVKAENSRKLFRKLEETDKELFNFDISSINWENYFENYIRGIRKHILNDPDETIVLARKKNYKKFFYLIGKLILTGVFLFFLCKQTSYNITKFRLKLFSQ